MRTKAGPGQIRSKDLIRGDGCVDCAVGRSRRDGCAAHAAKHSSLKRLGVGRIGADQVGHRTRQNIAEDSEAGPKHGFRLELPRDGCSRLQDSQRCGREQIAEMSLDGGVQRLIDIVRNGAERAAETADLIVRIQRIGIEGVAHTESPGQVRGHFPRVLRIDIKIEKVERLICVRGESLLLRWTLLQR